MSALYKQNTSVFRSEFAESIFHHKYSHEGAETWEELANTLVDDVCGSVLPPQSEVDQLKWMISTMRFIPVVAICIMLAVPQSFFNNCYLLWIEEDTREEWAALSQRAMSCLMSGGGIGVDYSILRGKERTLKRTGGTASGPIDLMTAIND